MSQHQLLLTVYKPHYSLFFLCSTSKQNDERAQELPPLVLWEIQSHASPCLQVRNFTPATLWHKTHLSLPFLSRKPFLGDCPNLSWKPPSGTNSNSDILFVFGWQLPLGGCLSSLCGEPPTWLSGHLSILFSKSDASFWSTNLSMYA